MWWLDRIQLLSRLVLWNDASKAYLACFQCVKALLGCLILVQRSIGLSGLLVSSTVCPLSSHRVEFNKGLDDEVHQIIGCPHARAIVFLFQGTSVAMACVFRFGLLSDFKIFNRHIDCLVAFLNLLRPWLQRLSHIQGLIHLEYLSETASLLCKCPILPNLCCINCLLRLSRDHPTHCVHWVIQPCLVSTGWLLGNLW